MVLPYVALHNTCTHDRIIFRGAFDYRDHIWRDWVVVDWGRHGQLPNKMWGFVDLRGLPADLPRNQQLKFGGVANLSPSIYAIVESTELSPSLHGDVNCDIFVHLHTEFGAKTDGFVSKLKFCLADVEAFVDPCIVIRNLDGEICQRASCATYGRDPCTLLHERLSTDSARSRTMQRH